MFKIGDRIESTKDNNNIPPGITGTIKTIEDNDYGIVFDVPIEEGHTIGGLCLSGYGWWVSKNDIKPLPKDEDFRVGDTLIAIHDKPYRSYNFIKDRESLLQVISLFDKKISDSDCISKDLLHKRAGEGSITATVIGIVYNQIDSQQIYIMKNEDGIFTLFGNKKNITLQPRDEQKETTELPPGYYINSSGQTTNDSNWTKGLNLI